MLGMTLACTYKRLLKLLVIETRATSYEVKILIDMCKFNKAWQSLATAVKGSIR